MSEIEVGEYVRTKNGDIAQVIEFRDELVLDKEIKFCGIYRSYLNEDELDFIVKHSKDIIDLIEEGDYVNGHLIIDRNNEILMYEDADYVNGLNTIGVWEIKSIATKEQFSSIEYKV